MAKYILRLRVPNKLLVFSILFCLLIFTLQTSTVYAHQDDISSTIELNLSSFPKQQADYQDSHMTSYGSILLNRIQVEPFNLVATILFFLAIIHSMLTSIFQKVAHTLEEQYQELINQGKRDKNSHSIGASIFHLIGEVEVVFGLWAVVLTLFIAFFYDFHTVVQYMNSLHYTEPLFVIVIMTIASSRPVIKIFELLLGKIVSLIGDSLEMWWITILIITPLLGSIITEPAAMTIGAFLLSDKFYSLQPSNRLKYATLALLFVNVSIGGVLTNFAAPPILMVAGTWNWDTSYMFLHFGWKAVVAILLSTGSFFLLFHHDLIA